MCSPCLQTCLQTWCRTNKGTEIGSFLTRELLEEPWGPARCRAQRGSACLEVWAEGGLLRGQEDFPGSCLNGELKKASLNLKLVEKTQIKRALKTM